MRAVTAALTACAVLLVGVFVAISADAPPRPAGAAPGPGLAIMGPSHLSAGQLAVYFRAQHRTPRLPAGMGLDEFFQIYLDEGAAYSVRGDVAIAQSIVETGWFGFQGSMVRPGDYNYAGMGACDTCSRGKIFLSVRSGIRAQIQALRNYADRNSRAANLPHPPVVQMYGMRRLANGNVVPDPALAAYNFDHFFLKGAAPNWNDMGNGRWATSTTYATTILSLYSRMRAAYGIPCNCVPDRRPTGFFESIVRTGASVRVKGWALDPDTAGPIRVHAYAGSGASRVGVSAVASASRPSVAAAYPNYGAGHGFEFSVPARSPVCIYAIGVGGSQNKLLGCRNVPINPYGHIDSITRTPQGVRLRGWAVDPDTATPIRVHVYTGRIGVGVGVGATTAAASRADLSSVLAGYGSDHGFDVTLPPMGAQVCLYLINRGPGSSVLLGCRNVPVSPVGNIELVQRVPTGVRVKGWAFDPDTAGSIRVHAYFGSGTNAVGAGSFLADGDRPDIASMHPGYGAAHGYDVIVPAGPGNHGPVCIYGINVGRGSNTRVACHSVPGDPWGSLDNVVRTSGGLGVSGWAIDPDTASPIRVHIYVDGHGAASLVTSVPRPDVAAAYPPFAGAPRGYATTVAADSGPHEVCAYAINVAVGAGNPRLGCKNV